MKHLKNILIIFAISVVITFIFDFTFGGINSNIKGLLLNILYGALIGGSLSLSGVVARLVTKKMDIKQNPVKTYVVLLISIFLYITIDVFAINSIWYNVTQDYSFVQIFASTGFWISNLLIILIGLVIFFIILSKTYIANLIATEKESQSAKNEALKFQYKALQAQVNPHFLFNSLNTLSSMISIEPVKAEDFVNHLSKLYRYVLDNKDKELINISDEILFINNYIVLQKYRFEDNIIFEAEESIKSIDGQIIPMSLQLLVENAIKHNIISDEHKLKINISYDKDNYICVVNNINHKDTGADSFKIGLKNIEERYSFITDRKCIFEENNGSFVVKLPIV